MRSVEFIGLPGVGKSTLCRDLLTRLHCVDKELYLSSREAFLQVSKTGIDRIFRGPINFLPQSLALRVSKRLLNRSIMQFDAQNRFLASNCKSLEAFLVSKAFKGMSLRDRRIVIGAFLETGSLWECFNGQLPAHKIVVFEEGFVQKSFMFVDRSNEGVVESGHLSVYLENIPLPNLIVYVTAGLETCQQRMMSRPEGLTERLKLSNEPEIKNFLTALQDHLKYVTDWLNSNYEGRLIEINNEITSDDNLEMVLERIQNLSA